ncbi:MAG: ATP synthase F1 subunit gamma [Myxococcales bacterium]
MPSLKIIRKRIVSTKATQKITKAMKMVAGARLARAQQRIVALRPYAIKTAEVLQNVATSMLPKDSEAESVPEHPLLAVRDEKNVLLLVLTSDRGLCGAFNTNINKAALRAWREKESAGATVSMATIGRKGREFLQRNKANVVQDFPNIYDKLDLTKVLIVSNWLVPRFEKAEFDAIYVVYNEFKSAISQKLVVERLLPIARPSQEVAEESKTPALAAEYIFEPSQPALLEKLVPMYIEISIYRALLESQASEHGARMSAMDSATRNAKDMIARLTLLYNRARQAAITKELMEIIGGAEALKD